MTIVDRIKEFRKMKKLTTRRLSQLSGIDETSLSRIQHGRVRPTIDTVQRIADALGLSLAKLLDTPEYTNENGDIPPPIAPPVFMIKCYFEGEHGVSIEPNPRTRSEFIPMCLDLCPDPKAIAVYVRKASLTNRGVQKGDLLIFSERARINSGDVCLVRVAKNLFSLYVVSYDEHSPRILMLQSANVDKKRFPDRILKRTKSTKVYRAIKLIRSI